MTRCKNAVWKSHLSYKNTVLAVLCTLVGASALANTISVNNLTDVQIPADGNCTLREAITNANTNSDTTGLDCAAGSGGDSITFTVGGTLLLGNTLNISDTAGLTLDGIGQSVTLSGNYTVRVILLNPGASLTVRNLTVANGFDSTTGGGIFNQFGTLTVVNSTFTGNTANRNGGAIANYRGTAINNPGGDLTVVNSTFIGNSAAFGGGIMNNGLSNLTVINSTIVGNSVSIPVCPVGFVCIGQASGGGIYSSGSLNLDNSIVAGNTSPLGSPDIGGYINTASYNLIGDFLLTYVWNGIGVPVPLNGNNGNVTGVDVNSLLETTLTNNGGPTETLALLPNSLAIDAANDGICANPLLNYTDQRGIARPQGTQCDIGAYELAVAASVDLAVTQTASPTPSLVRDSLSWTITVVNNGTSAATNVKLTDTLPTSGLSKISASASQGSCSLPTLGVIGCNLGSLASGASTTVIVKGIPSTTTTLTNQVNVVGDQFDAQSVNNTATQSVTVQPLLCNGLVPTIVGTPGPDSLKGTKGRDIIHGLSGNDTITGNSGNDIICGGEGQDSLSGNDGNDALNGVAGTDSCNGGAGTDTATNCEAKIAIP